MEPFASGKGWTLYCGDALEVIGTLPAASVGAVVTDPPYADCSSEAAFVKDRSGIVREGQFFEAWLREHMTAWRRVSLDSAVWWFTIDWFGALQVDAACSKLGLRRPVLGIWDRGGMGMGFVMRHTYEVFAVVALPAWQRQNASVVDVWRVPWSPGDRTHGHSAEKPFALLSRAVEGFVQRGAVILDPFAGSGTTGLAALKAGHGFIGIERDADFCTVAAERLRQAETAIDGTHAATPLFGGAHG